MILNRKMRLAALVLPFVLSGCGGSQDSSSTANTSPATPTTAPTISTTPTSSPPTSTAPVSTTPITIIQSAIPPSVDNADFSLRRSSVINTRIGRLNVTGTYSTKKLYYKNTQQEVSEFIIDGTEAIILKIAPDPTTDNYQLDAVYFSEDGSSQVSADITVSVYADFQGQVAKVLPLGDSITDGYNNISYRYRLKQKTLDDASVDIDFIGSQDRPSELFSDTQHDGFIGYRTDEILYGRGGIPSLENRLNSISVPDIVLIHEGTNDMLQGYSASHAADHIALTIDELRQRNPNIIILLGQIVPSYDSNANQSTIDLNSRLANLKNSMYTDASPIILVDHYSNFYLSDLSDGIHPNESGEEKMAQRWFEAMLPLFDGYQ